MIEIRNLSKRYGPTVVLDRLDLRVGSGEVVFLLGDNGTGKSTLFRCMLGLTGYAGTIRIGGHDPLSEGRRVRERMGYMPQDDGLHGDLSVADTMSFYARLRGASAGAADELLEDVRLGDAADRRVDQISGGMRQRLAFALAQVGGPDVLLLDEPTASLDGLSREHLMERIRRLAESGKTVLLSTHSGIGDLAGSSRALLLRDGKLQALDRGAAVARAALRLEQPGPVGSTGVIGWTVDNDGNAIGGSRC